ncbi:YceI family protein [Frigidibacter sp. SD6-1]|uniref:YceI family protein n=1 Tax=Frigidibacter sp. SD6-1 TaxID=3032581 RepID=UPI0024E03CB6|nr:YceI family protein [Frigidibacter sp. SD6-1]
MRHFALSTAALLFAGLSAAAEETSGPSQAPPPGSYQLDPAHARLIFSVSHLGFSDYTAFFRKMDATLGFDPDNPESMTLTATVDPSSVETLYPDPAYDFNAILAGESFLDAANHPEIRFASTIVRQTGPHEAAVTGDLTLHGTTRPITLRVRYNGGYAGHPLDAGARIGFSAEGAIFRSDFGMGFGIPAPGTTIGVGDLVTIRIEAEFLNPDAQGVQTGP